MKDSLSLLNKAVETKLRNRAKAAKAQAEKAKKDEVNKRAAKAVEMTNKAVGNSTNRSRIAARNKIEQLKKGNK